MIAFIVIFGGYGIFLITDGIIILCDSQATGTGDIAYGTVKIISGLLFIALGWLTTAIKRKKRKKRTDPYRPLLRGKSYERTEVSSKSIRYIFRFFSSTETKPSLSS